MTALLHLFSLLMVTFHHSSVIRFRIFLISIHFHDSSYQIISFLLVFQQFVSVLLHFFSDSEVSAQKLRAGQCHLEERCAGRAFASYNVRFSPSLPRTPSAEIIGLRLPVRLGSFETSFHPNDLALFFRTSAHTSI